MALQALLQPNSCGVLKIHLFCNGFCIWWETHCKATLRYCKTNKKTRNKIPPLCSELNPKISSVKKKISCWKSILHPLTVTARVCKWGPVSLHPLLCRSPQRSVQLQVWTGAQAGQQGWEEGAAEDRRLALAMQLNLSVSWLPASPLFYSPRFFTKFIKTVIAGYGEFTSLKSSYFVGK